MVNISEERKEELLSSIKIIQVSKGTLLQEKDKLNPDVYYVRSGLLRSYTIDSKGKEHIFLFGPEGWVVSEMAAHVQGSKSEFFVDAVEDTEVEVISGKLIHNYENLINQSEVAEEIHRLFRRIQVLQKRVIMLMSATALERYKDFVATYPSIVERVPQRMIASYLGLTPEALSKVKSKYLKEG